MRALSEKIGISHSFVGKVEQNERRLDVIEYLHYCNALEVSPVDGLREVEKNFRNPVTNAHKINQN